MITPALRARSPLCTPAEGLVGSYLQKHCHHFSLFTLPIALRQHLHFTSFTCRCLLSGDVTTCAHSILPATPTPIADSGLFTATFSTRSDGIATLYTYPNDFETTDGLFLRRDFTLAARSAHTTAERLERHAQQHVRFVTTETLGESRRRRDFR